MKRLVFLSSALCLLALSLGIKSFAQKGGSVKGSFEATSKEKAAISGTYSVMPAYNDHVVLQLLPAQPFDLNARIVNAKGEEVMKIDAEHVGLRYAKSLDVSKLPAGDYFIEIAGGSATDKNTRIPFTR